MSTYASNAVWRHSTARGTELLVMLALANVADADWVTYPGVEWIAGQARVSTRNAQYAIRRLVESGELVVEGSGGRGKLNKYRINLPDEGSKRLVPGAHREPPPASSDRVQSAAPYSEHDRVQSAAPFDTHKGCNPAPKGCKLAPERVQTGADVKRSNTGITRRDTSSSRRSEEEDAASSLFVTFCEITNSTISGLPGSTIASQERIAADLLTDHSATDVEGCMRWLQTWRRVPWTMATVRKEIDEWIAKGRPASGKTEPAPAAKPGPTLDPERYKNGGHLNVRGRPT